MQKISVSFNKDLRSLPLSFLEWNLFCVAHNFHQQLLLHYISHTVKTLLSKEV